MGETATRSLPVPTVPSRRGLRDQAPTAAQEFWRRLRRSRSAKIGGVLIALFLLTALVAPFVTPFDPLGVSLRERLQAPNGTHWLGTDALGRDILSRLIAGSRISLSMGVIVGLLAAAVGIPIGIVAGYRSGAVDELSMRVMDALLALPGILLAIGIVATLGPGLQNAMIAVGVASVPSFARVARASTLRIKHMLFVEAAQSLGGTMVSILWKHVLPNAISPLLVLFSLRVATGILTASSLGFLGLGVQPPEPEWGAMLSDGRNYIRTSPHVTIMPGLAIMLVVLAFNLFGDGLRDALDPRMKESRSAAAEQTARYRG